MKRKISTEVEIDVELEDPASEIIQALEKKIKSLESMVSRRDKKIEDLQNQINRMTAKHEVVQEFYNRMKSAASDLFDLVDNSLVYRKSNIGSYDDGW